jgi:hypothetical protein
MTYTVRIPGKPEPIQMEAATLKNAYAAGNIPAKTLVTLEHQDFWYSVAELMGDKPAKPLLFPCPTCKQMIRARALDRGNPVSCGRCQSATVVPNPRETRERATAATEKARKKPMFWAGLVTTVIGTALVFYPVLFPEPAEQSEVRYEVISFAIIILGVAMMTGTRFLPGRAPHDK